jgi:cob(I)alamin adenosyltransferase
MSKKIKSPKELFEAKRLDLLERLESQKIIEQEIIREKENNRKIVSPKILFDDPVVEEKKPTVIEEYVEEIQEENLQELVYSLSNNVDQIKENIVSKGRYNNEIKSLKNYIDTFKEEKFDATYIYKNLFILREEIDSIRSEIPEIPEPILYDEDLDQLRNVIVEVKNSIPVVPEIKYYDQELQELLTTIDSIREQIGCLPEVKYYDEQIEKIEQRLVEVNESIPVVPEIKYYDEDIVHLHDKIDQVNSSIPTIPEFPEVRYYDDQIVEIESKIGELKESINLLPEPKYYDEELNTIGQKIIEIKNSIPEPQVLPEVKYYDEEIESLKNNFDNLSKKVISAKKTDKKELEKLYENYQKSNALLNDKIRHLEEIFEHFNESQKEYLQETITEPPQTDNKDPLTPLDQNFVTFKQLQEHYRTFINRIQQQLSTLGGGGETQLKYLDDVVGIATNPSAYNGKFLKYDHPSRKFVFETVVGGGGGGADLDAFSVTVDSPGTANLSYNNTNGVFTYTPPNLVGYATENYVNNLVAISTFSGNYNDLTNAPTALSSFSNDVGFVTSSIVVGYATEGYVNNLVAISTFSGDYNDLTNAPTGLSAFVDDVGYATVAGGSMNLSDILGIGTAATQLSTLTTSTIDSFPITTYRSARYQVQISQGTDYQCTDLLVIHNDSTASLVESGSVATNNYLATFSTTISGSNLLLQVDMINAASAEIKVVKYAVTV